jgi:hypothetical protein
MSSYDDVVRGDNGFTYEVRSIEGSGLADIRDAQDELFAQVEYFPREEEYVVKIDGGYTTWEDLKELGFISGMNIQETNVPEFDNMIGTFETDIIDDWRNVKRASLKHNGRSLEIDNIMDDERKTLVRLISDDEEISSVAETLANKFNPPSINGEPGDPYRKTWAGYGNARVIRRESSDREQTVEEVFSTAFNLTEDILEETRESQR